MCKDPGIEEAIYDHYFKTRYGCKIDGDQENAAEDIENLVAGDDETEPLEDNVGAAAPSQRDNKQSGPQKRPNLPPIPEHSNEYYLELMDDMNYIPGYFEK